MNTVDLTDLEQLEVDLQALYEEIPAMRNTFQERMVEAVMSEESVTSAENHPGIVKAFADELQVYKAEKRIEAKVIAAAEEYVKEMIERLEG